MNLVIGQEYYHVKLNIRVTLLDTHSLGYVTVQDEDGVSILTQAFNLQELKNMSLDEIIRRES